MCGKYVFCPLVFCARHLEETVWLYIHSYLLFSFTRIAGPQGEQPTGFKGKSQAKYG